MRVLKKWLRKLVLMSPTAWQVKMGSNASVMVTKEKPCVFNVTTLSVKNGFMLDVLVWAYTSISNLHRRVNSDGIVLCADLLLKDRKKTKRNAKNSWLNLKRITTRVSITDFSINSSHLRNLVYRFKLDSAVLRLTENWMIKLTTKSNKSFLDSSRVH